MNFFKIFIIYSIVILNLSAFLFANTTNSAVFLRINSSARTAALGGVGNAIFGDVSNTEQNPASLFWLQTKQVMFSHNEWFEGIRSEYVTFALPLNYEYTYMFGVSVKYLYMNDMTKRDEQGNDLGTFGASDSVYTVSVAKKIYDKMAIGVNLKFITQSIDVESGSAFAGDLGFLYNTESAISFALAIRNLGSKLKIYQEEAPLPLTYSVGAAYYVQETLNVGVDIDVETNCDPVYKLGGEYMISPNFDIRAGYVITTEDYDNLGVTAGFGFNLNYKLYLDYAYVPFGELQDTHRISLKYLFE